MPFLSQSESMAEERERRKANEVTVQVADEGNVPGQPSAPGILLIAVIVLIGLVLIYVASSYASSHPPNSPPESSQWSTAGLCGFTLLI